MPAAFIPHGTAFKIRVMAVDTHGVRAEDESDFLFSAGMDLDEYNKALQEDKNRIPGYPAHRWMTLVFLSSHLERIYAIAKELCCQPPTIEQPRFITHGS